MYDIAIIGAGINGCSIAYEFAQEGKKVIIFDMEKVANGGSGAAGAFISPKFSKAGELKALLHDAFVYSMEYYEKNFPHLISKVPLLHIAKDVKDAKTLVAYKKSTSLELLTPSDEILNSLNEVSKNQENVSLNAGIVNAELMCKAMSKSAQFVKHEVKNLIYDDNAWVIDDTYVAKELVLATGAYKKLINEPYIKLRGVWGHRIDISTDTQNTYSIHQHVSISPSQNTLIAIGATHNLNYHPQISTESYDIKSGREELINKASKTLKFDDFKVVKDYMGLRSGSFDYMPLLGRLVMSKETLLNKDINFKVKKANHEVYHYYPNLYMINGSGGYGFVLAPYLSKILKEYIMYDKKISERLAPARFFARWAKKI